MTTVALPAVRGPVALAKALSALDVMSGGRAVAGVGPGSSRLDYEAVGIAFEERWPRFDEAVRAMQSLWDPSRGAFSGRVYSTAGIALEPPPRRPGGLPIWIGSWGSDVGMRRVARLADGWLGSAYNTEPELFRAAREVLDRHLKAQGREPAAFPNAIATGFMYLTSDADQARRVRREIVAPMIRREESEVERRLLIGSPAECVEKLSAYAEAGAQAFFVWPIADEIEQLEAFAAEVAPNVR
jgi:alkanesulfonate monooxygenase SsuD/methylene tetrahydromethanopterin reductase-like flavin-dependent oxidoreductase (luciferase family)